VDEQEIPSVPARSWDRWLAVVLLTLAAGFAAIWAWRALRVTSPVTAPAASSVSAAIPDLASARHVLTGYFEAPDDELRTSFLYDAGRVRPLWLDYYHRRNKSFPMLIRLDEGRLAVLGSKTVALFQARLDPGGLRPIALIWNGSRFEVDWESSVVYGTMDWIEWVETRPAAPQLLRVYLSKAGVDGLAGSERDAGWMEVVAEHPDGLQPLPLRIPAGTLFPVDFHGRQRVPVTAEFRFSGGKGELVKFLHEGWSR